MCFLFLPPTLSFLSFSPPHLLLNKIYTIDLGLWCHLHLNSDRGTSLIIDHNGHSSEPQDISTGGHPKGWVAPESDTLSKKYMALYEEEKCSCEKKIFQILRRGGLEEAPSGSQE